LGNPPENKEQDLSKTSGQEDFKELSPCCLKTVQTFVANNPMISCHTCKTMIKSFKDEREFRKFLRFCYIQKRKVSISKFNEYWIVFFRPYQS
jgi:hypothetical protein